MSSLLLGIIVLATFAISLAVYWLATELDKTRS